MVTTVLVRFHLYSYTAPAGDSDYHAESSLKEPIPYRCGTACFCALLVALFCPGAECAFKRGGARLVGAAIAVSLCCDRRGYPTPLGSAVTFRSDITSAIDDSLVCRASCCLSFSAYDLGLVEDNIPDSL